MASMKARQYAPVAPNMRSRACSGPTTDPHPSAVRGRGIRRSVLGHVHAVALPPNDQTAFLQEKLNALRGRERDAVKVREFPSGRQPGTGRVLTSAYPLRDVFCDLARGGRDGHR
jgi:hypothetical protein